jgi:uncharacterized protein YjaG (DUF416 family)
VKLQGIMPNISCCNLITVEQLEGLLKNEAVEHLLELSTLNITEGQSISQQEIQAFVQQFADLFAEPTGLPPNRSHDMLFHWLP